MKPRVSLSAVLLFVLLCVIPGQAQGPEVQGTLGTGFTYQGQLRQGGSPYTGTCDFQFSLWTAASGGSQVGTTLTKGSVAVARGFFTTLLDFGGSAFQGDTRYLGVKVRCPAGSGAYVTLSPRQAISASPYALYALGGPSAGVPAGVIVMWSGRLDAIPVGWALCDGTNGTPDLRNRFVLGAAPGQNPGQTGGTSTHSHTVAAHTHPVDPPSTVIASGGSHSHYLTDSSSNRSVPTWSGGPSVTVAPDTHSHGVYESGAHSHSVDILSFASGSATSTTDTAGNVPPYYTVAYIMKQ